MRNRILALVLAAFLAFALAACGDPERMSREALYADVADMVEDREQIPEEYLACLEEPLAAQLREYNEQTAVLREYYTEKGLSIAENYDLWLQLFGVRDRWSAHYDLFSDRYAQHCLYPDASRRVRRDWYLAGFAESDSGGSYGMWAYWMHKDFVMGDWFTAERIQGYFDLVDGLTEELT